MFLIILFICLCAVCVTTMVYMRKTSTETKVKSLEVQIENDFPQYDGMNARKVLVELNATYPQYSAEIVSDEVVFVDTDSDPATPVEANVCGFESVTIETNSPFADEYIWYEDGFVMPGEISSSLTVTASNNYQVQAFDKQCAAEAFSQIVIVNLCKEEDLL